MIRFRHKGDLKLTTKFFNAVSGGKYLDHVLNKYGALGVEALAANTPKDSGKTAASWVYRIERYSDGNISIAFDNTNVVKDWFNVAINLQLGHGTKNGGWVSGVDYINPALTPIFQQLADSAWAEVTRN